MVVSLAVGALASAGASAAAKAVASTGLVGLSGGISKGAFAAASLPAWGVGHGAWWAGHGALGWIPGMWPRPIF